MKDPPRMEECEGKGTRGESTERSEGSSLILSSMSQYLLEKYQILVCLLGTWNMIELMESNPASPSSLHHFDIYEIKGECDIEGCPDDSIRKGNLTEWREFLR
jgi:hypothetical protein